MAKQNLDQYYLNVDICQNSITCINLSKSANLTMQNNSWIIISNALLPTLIPINLSLEEAHIHVCTALDAKWTLKFEH